MSAEKSEIIEHNITEENTDEGTQELLAERLKTFEFESEEKLGLKQNPLVTNKGRHNASILDFLLPGRSQTINHLVINQIKGDAVKKQEHQFMVNQEERKAHFKTVQIHDIDSPENGIIPEYKEEGVFDNNAQPNNQEVELRDHLQSPWVSDANHPYRAGSNNREAAHEEDERKEDL